jgi:hypothetical protein
VVILGNFGEDAPQVKNGVMGDDDVAFLPKLCQGRRDLLGRRGVFKQLQPHRSVLDDPVRQRPGAMNEGVIEMNDLAACGHKRCHGDLCGICPAGKHIVIGAAIGLKVDGKIAHRIFFLLA